MADIINEVASRTGMTPDQTRQALGALLAVAKEKLPAETFAKIHAVVPDADGLMATAQSESAAASGGIAGAISAVAGKLLGSKTGDLMGTLARLGVTPEQVEKFAPSVLAALKGRVPDDVLKQITAMLPASAASPT